jgi:hypothetical protein
VSPETVNESVPAPRYPWTLAEAATRLRAAHAELDRSEEAVTAANATLQAAWSARAAARTAYQAAEHYLFATATQT